LKRYLSLSEASRVIYVDFKNWLALFNFVAFLSKANDSGSFANFIFLFSSASS
jgi:hypothetical protein